MERLLEQRYAVKFCVKLGKSSKDTHDLIKAAYGDNAMSRSGVFEWHKLFREGREEVEDAQRSGRTSTTKSDENVARVKTLLNSDRRLSLSLISEELGIAKTQVYEIVTENLAMRKVCAKLVPRVLTDEQKETRARICQENLDLVSENPDF
ncbi:PREDICTED: putative uncharacterized protein FLJ37770 [Vollenhovia emeryi]|uniref:putative uncharacterized protein FLJ37770 n=1 Tax=Vollenhovia emeryi TaxID=411798 RepID=UPI0005F48777|nr:PREDICTED: putative uncharacterized protein FLJ37770 [Vollenhovia emeryi]